MKVVWKCWLCGAVREEEIIIPKEISKEVLEEMKKGLEDLSDILEGKRPGTTLICRKLNMLLAFILGKDPNKITEGDWIKYYCELVLRLREKVNE